MKTKYKERCPNCGSAKLVVAQVIGWNNPRLECGDCGTAIRTLGDD